MVNNYCLRRHDWVRVLLYVFLCLYFTNFLLLHFYLCSVLAPSCSNCTCNTITYVFSMYSVLNIVLWFSEDLINVFEAYSLPPRWSGRVVMGQRMGWVKDLIRKCKEKENLWNDFISAKGKYLLKERTRDQFVSQRFRRPENM